MSKVTTDYRYTELGRVRVTLSITYSTYSCLSLAEILMIFRPPFEALRFQQNMKCRQPHVFSLMLTFQITNGYD